MLHDPFQGGDRLLGVAGPRGRTAARLRPSTVQDMCLKRSCVATRGCGEACACGVGESPSPTSLMSPWEPSEQPHGVPRVFSDVRARSSGAPRPAPQPCAPMAASMVTSRPCARAAADVAGPIVATMRGRSLAAAICNAPVTDDGRRERDRAIAQVGIVARAAGSGGVAVERLDRQPRPRPPRPSDRNDLLDRRRSFPARGKCATRPLPLGNSSGLWERSHHW